MTESQLNTKDCTELRLPFELTGSVLLGFLWLLTSCGCTSAKPSDKASQGEPVELAPIAALLSTLSDQQRSSMVFPYDAPIDVALSPSGEAYEKRNHVCSWWSVSDPVVASSNYTEEQQDLIKRAVRNVSSEEGFQWFWPRLADEKIYSPRLAVFGTPDSDSFEWVLTARHITLRGGGKLGLFAGPLFYGERAKVAKEKPMNSRFQPVVSRATDLFRSLTPEQQKRALHAATSAEVVVPCGGESRPGMPELFYGAHFDLSAPIGPSIAVSEFNSEQKESFLRMIRQGLWLYNGDLVDAKLADVSQTIDHYRIAYYEKSLAPKMPQRWAEKLPMLLHDSPLVIKSDGEMFYFSWRIEGPDLRWYFKGRDHLHSYLDGSRSKKR